MSLLSHRQDPFRIKDTAQRAITLEQLEQVLDYVKEELESGRKEWWRNDENVDDGSQDTSTTISSNKTRILSLEEVTLYDLNENLIVPLTKDHDCSLVELLAEEEQPPDYFVSHWWGEPVVDFVACLQQHCHDRGLTCQPGDEHYVEGQSLGRSPRYWICAYANNQHQLYRELVTPLTGSSIHGHGNDDDPSSLPVDPVASVEQTSFVRAMNLSRGTLLVVDQQGKCFSRLWCVYEIFSSLVRRDCKVGRSQQIRIGMDSGNAAQDGDDTPAWSIFGSNRHYFFDLYTATSSPNPNQRIDIPNYYNKKKHAVGITDGTVAVDSNAETKWLRESNFPIDRLQHGIHFDCRHGKASVPADEIRIHQAIGSDDKHLQLNQWVHGLVATSGLRRALESEDPAVAEQFLRAMELGKVCKLSLFLGGSAADTPATVAQVLTALDAEACCLLDLQSDSITHLPDNFGRFHKLTHLCLSGCSNLQNLPESFVGLKSLTSILLQFGSSLQCLPHDIGRIQALTKMSLDGCTSLTTLPASMGQLVHLERLYLTDCTGLTALPESLADCKEIQVIHLNRCIRLARLPRRIGIMTSLEDLQLQHCQSLTELPRSMKDLRSLQRLNLWYCTGLRNLPELRQPNLTNLELGGVNADLVDGWEAARRRHYALAE